METFLSFAQIEAYLGNSGQTLLSHTCTKIPKESLLLPSSDWIDRCGITSDRPIQVLRNLQVLFNQGNLSGTGYLNILPVDQGIEHSAGASFAFNPDYLNPENLVLLAIEAGCSGIASSLGLLGSIARKYAHKIPFILKINHNESLTYPQAYDQTLFASVEQAWNMGCVGVGATVYFGSPESKRQITEISRCFDRAHQLGLITILWCYLRNSAFKTKEIDYHFAVDLTSQANYLGATLQADIVKQKLPLPNHGLTTLKMAGTNEKMYDLMGTHPIDLVRYQIANGYNGRVGLINSGGPSGKDDLNEIIQTSVINKRAGGWGVVAGRKAFQKSSMKEGIKLLKAIQSVYLCKEISIA